MGVVFNCRKESASQKSMKSNNGQLSKNEVVGSFLMPVFYFWTAEQPSLALRACSASLTLFNFSVVSSAVAVGEICQQL